MLIDDDSVRAYHATRILIALYDAYRATARAQIAAFQQAHRHLARRRKPDPKLPAKLAHLRRQEALAWETDAVYAERISQLAGRLREIVDPVEEP